MRAISGIKEVIFEYNEIKHEIIYAKEIEPLDFTFWGEGNTPIYQAQLAIVSTKKTQRLLAAIYRTQVHKGI